METAGADVGGRDPPSVAAPRGAKTAASSPGMLARCFLNGEPMISEASREVVALLPSGGGVPAFADVEFTEAGVLADGESSAVRWEDLRASEGSFMGSAEC